MALQFLRRKKKDKKDRTEQDEKRPEAAESPAESAAPESSAAVDDPSISAAAEAMEETKAGPAGTSEPATEEASAVADKPEPEEKTAPPSSGGLYQRLRKGLSKTRQILTTDIETLFTAGQAVDEDTLDDLEERLITADIGVAAATEIIASVHKAGVKDGAALKEQLKQTMISCLSIDQPVPPPAEKPQVIMVVGVNGVGKTTTIGKLAANYARAGQSVLLVAADTFRAAAIEQLEIWAQRTHAGIVKHRENSDPSAVVFDGIEAARARDIDVVIIDTAGRLHTKTNLMEELKKIKRTIAKKMPEAPHQVLLVLDATTGQNALSQAQTFAADTGVTGIVLTKLDGTAKGGIAVNLCRTFGIPLQYIGVGEQVDDLQPFEPEKFIEALL